MKVKTQGEVLIMGVGTNEYEGKVYYSCDVYDTEGGSLYRLSIDGDIFSQLANSPKPAKVDSLILDISPQYQGKSRVKLLGWKA